ncbi:MAG TPA: HEAT repeat domain-containing protein [bacterium]|nr:HEAT repeat domain-containing protein [bacterium]
MNNKAILFIVVLVAALVVFILLWPQTGTEPPEVKETPKQIASPTQVQPPTPLPVQTPAAAIQIEEGTTTVSVEPTPEMSIDRQLDLLLADFAPTVLGSPRDKAKLMDILKRMAAFGDAAVDRLAGLMHSPIDENVREFAAYGLALIGTPKALGELLKAIRNEQDPRIKDNLRAQLCKINNPACMEQVIEGLLQDSVDWWAEDAGKILTSLGGPSVVTSLLDWSGRVDDNYQQRIANTLSEIRNPEAVSALSDAIKPGVRPEIQTGAGNALAMIGTPEATQALLDAVKGQTDEEYRERILTACRHISNKDSVPLLDKALDDMSDPLIRAAAANALGNFDNEPILAHLQTAYDRETDPRARQAIADAIQRIASRSF